MKVIKDKDGVVTISDSKGNTHTFEKQFINEQLTESIKRLNTDDCHYIIFNIDGNKNRK